MLACILFSMITGTDQTDIPFFKKCVEKYFGLEPPDDFSDEEKRKFQKPQFEKYLRKKEDPTKFTHFQKTALRIEKFFKRHNDWETTKATPAFKNPIENLQSI
ncbi:Hypothetical predicted protein, partial [Paramuricea clavata]